MQNETLKVGDTVLWRGAFGRDAAREAVVEAIEHTANPHEKDGDDVDSIDWETVRADRAIVTLDNGHWAYGIQIYPLT